MIIDWLQIFKVSNDPNLQRRILFNKICFEVKSISSIKVRFLWKDIIRLEPHIQLQVDKSYSKLSWIKKVEKINRTFLPSSNAFPKNHIIPKNLWWNIPTVIPVNTDEIEC